MKNNYQFKNHNFDTADVLTRDQMKMILGGQMEPGGGGTCQAQTFDEFGTSYAITGLSKDDAVLNANYNQSHWCCDSCCTATWADHTGCPSYA